LKKKTIKNQLILSFLVEMTFFSMLISSIYANNEKTMISVNRT